MLPPSLPPPLSPALTNGLTLLAQAATGDVPTTIIDRIIGPEGALVGAILVIALIVRYSGNGTIRWGPAVDLVIKAKDDQIAAGEARVAAAESRADKLSEENRELNAFLRNSGVPALTSSADALSRAVRALDQERR